MPLSSILLLLALLVLVALFVARPFLDPRSADEVDYADEISPWIAERDRVLDALAELDNDFQLGKVPEDVYQPQRSQLLAKGAQALGELEKLDVMRSKADHNLSDDELEKLIAARKRRVRK